MIRFAIALAAVPLATPAVAELKSSSATHLESENKAIVAATPAEVYAAIGRIGAWWNPKHSFSGQAGAMTLDLKAGGCFCETLDEGGSVEHGRVIMAWPARMIRLEAPMGPLQGEAVSARLTWILKPVDGGTEITQNYLVGGHFRNGAGQLAGPVDMVVTEQFQRLVAAVRE